MFSSDEDIESMIEKGVPSQSPNTPLYRPYSQNRPSIRVTRPDDDSNSESAFEMFTGDRSKRKEKWDTAVKITARVDKKLERELKHHHYYIYPRSQAEVIEGKHPTLRRLTNFEWQKDGAKEARSVLSKAYIQFAEGELEELFIIMPTFVVRYGKSPMVHHTCEKEVYLPYVCISYPPDAFKEKLKKGYHFKKNVLEESHDVLCLKEERACNESFVLLMGYMFREELSYLIFSVQHFDKGYKMAYTFEEEEEKDWVEVKGLISSIWLSHLAKQHAVKEHKAVYLETTDTFELRLLRGWYYCGWEPKYVEEQNKSSRKKKH